MGFLKLSYDSETDYYVKVMCPKCKETFTIDKSKLISIDNRFESKSSLGEICPTCKTGYSSITTNQAEINSNEEFVEKPLKPSRRSYSTTSTNTGCGMFIGSAILFFLIILFAKGCNVNKSIIPDSYFEPGGGGREQYQKDVDQGEYIYKLKKELEKQKR